MGTPHPHNSSSTSSSISGGSGSKPARAHRRWDIWLPSHKQPVCERRRRGRGGPGICRTRPQPCCRPSPLQPRRRLRAGQRGQGWGRLSGERRRREAERGQHRLSRLVTRTQSGVAPLLHYRRRRPLLPPWSPVAHTSSSSNNVAHAQLGLRILQATGRAGRQQRRPLGVHHKQSQAADSCSSCARRDVTHVREGLRSWEGNRATAVARTQSRTGDLVRPPQEHSLRARHWTRHAHTARKARAAEREVANTGTGAGHPERQRQRHAAACCASHAWPHCIGQLHESLTPCSVMDQAHTDRRRSSGRAAAAGDVAGAVAAAGRWRRQRPAGGRQRRRRRT